MSSSSKPYTPLEGKVFAITGGASGIGYATAKILSSRGAAVGIADVDPEALKAAEDYFSSSSPQEEGTGRDAAATTARKDKFLVSKVDVSKRAEVDAWIASIVAKFGRLDGAANVAGIIGKHHGLAAVAELDDDEWDKIIAVNLTGMMYCLRAELRSVVDGGSIVNVSSIHGIKGLTKAAALENGAREIRVNSVAPGAIYTPLMKKAWDFHNRADDAEFDEPTAFQRQGTAEETANVIAFLLGPESTFVSGSVYSVDGGWI
ncbi:hypothetical protein G7054_g13862 [Neopestalotiopsis clavispora]|nr:hypothetical protein G7054_g13862 [Neopestalotiopsis clavispora]